MFTPQIPRRIFIALATATILTIPNLGKAQDEVRLKPLPEYEASLAKYYTQKVKTACVEHQASTKRKWWYYLPTIGYSFGFPSISGGTNQLIQVDQDKQKNRAKLAAIISQGLLEYRTDLHQLRSMYQTIQLERTIVMDGYMIEKMESNVFSIAAEADQKKEIKPVEYQQAQLLYQRQVVAHEVERRNYMFKIVELARFARYQFPEEVLLGLDSLGLNSRQVVLGSSPAHPHH